MHEQGRRGAGDGRGAGDRRLIDELVVLDLHISIDLMLAPRGQSHLPRINPSLTQFLPPARFELLARRQFFFACSGRKRGNFLLRCSSIPTHPLLDLVGAL